MRRYSFDWHNDQCTRSQEYLDPANGHKRFFCITHGQWAAELPVRKKITYEYGDGQTETQDFALNEKGLMRRT